MNREKNLPFNDQNKKEVSGMKEKLEKKKEQVKEFVKKNWKKGFGLWSSWIWRIQGRNGNLCGLQRS